MRFCRSLLLSSVMVLSTVGAASAAQMLQPQGSWAVTKVEGKQPGSAPYCALARRYDNGSIVTFARNRLSETSVAVDFPPGSFKPSRDYTIVLNAGAGASRSYKTQPVSERGIVIRMGRDDKFYQALDQTGALGVSVDDQAYTFAMNDIKSGNEDLSACLGGAAQAARQAEAMQEKPMPVIRKAAAPSAPVQSAPSPMPVQNAAVVPVPAVSAAPTASDSEMQSLKEENTRLRNAMERERRTYEDKMQQSDSSAASNELNEKLQLLQNENAQLKTQMSSAKPAAIVAAAPVTCPVPEDNAPLKAENAQLKSDLDAEKKRLTLAPDTAPLDGLKAENAQLKADLEAQKQKLSVAQTAAQNTATADSLKTENVQLKADLETQKQKVASLELAQSTAASAAMGKKQTTDDVAAATKRAADAEAQLASLRDQVSKAQAENDSLKTTLATRQSASEDSAKTDVATIARMHTLEDQLAQIKSERDRYADQIEAMKKSGSDVKISSANWDLEKATERYNQAEAEVRRMGSMVEQERAKCTVEKKNIEYMLFDPKIASKEQTAKLVSLENELAAAKKAQGAAPTAANDKDMQDLRAQLTAANDQIEAMRKMPPVVSQPLPSITTQPLASNEPSADTTAMRQQIASLNTQLAVMRNEKAKMADKLSRISTSSGDAKAPSMKPAIEATSLAPERPAMDVPVAIMPPAELNKMDVAPPVPASAAPVQTMATVVPPPSGQKLMTPSDMDGLLRQAGIGVTGPVQSVGSGKDQVAYQWKTGPLTGRAEQKLMDAPTQFDRFAQDYLAKVKSGCKGQFGAVPGIVNLNGGNRMAVYEVACMDEKSDDGPSSAVVFYSRNGVFTTVSHDGKSSTMDVAMDLRDKLVSALDSGKTAAR